MIEIFFDDIKLQSSHCLLQRFIHNCCNNMLPITVKINHLSYPSFLNGYDFYFSWHDTAIQPLFGLLFCAWIISKYPNTKAVKNICIILWLIFNLGLTWHDMTWSLLNLKKDELSTWALNMVRWFWAADRC